MVEGRQPSRRTLIQAAGVGLGVAALPSVAPAATPAPADAPAPPLWTAEYWAQKGTVQLYMYRKRLGAPRPGEPAKPVLFLVHGSSISSRPSFDLTVPGKGEYSLMNVFAQAGFDVWTMDHEGYGRSTRTEGNSDIRSGVADLTAGIEVVARETGQRRAHFFGESSGALRAAAFAAALPDRVDRLVLQAFVWTGEGSPTLKQRAERLEFYRTHSRRPRDREMIRSIFTRDKPGTSDMAVAEALAEAELVHGDSIPTGTYLDMTANLPVVDPRQVQSPVLLLRGEHDGIATLDDLLKFYALLPNPDRQFVLFAHAAHSLAFGLNRAQMWHVARSFLTMPAPVGA